MVYEFIATLAAGFGMAGIALIILHLAKFAGIQAPKWLIPLFAALGIFAFQIHQEYFWFDQKVAKLPDGVEVVKTIEESTWFRPWSYFKPQTVRFMAADLGQIHNHKSQPAVKMVNLYFFSRRMSVKRVPQLIDCANQMRADYHYPKLTTDSTNQSSASDLDAYHWSALRKDDPLFISVCQ